MSSLDTIKVQLNNIETAVTKPVTPPVALNFDASFPVITDVQTQISSLPVDGGSDATLVPTLTEIISRLTDVQVRVNGFGLATVTGSVTSAQVLATVADILTKATALQNTGSTASNALTVLVAARNQTINFHGSITAMSGTGGTPVDNTRVLAGINALLNQVALPPV